MYFFYMVVSEYLDLLYGSQWFKEQLPPPKSQQNCVFLISPQMSDITMSATFCFIKAVKKPTPVQGEKPQTPPFDETSVKQLANIFKTHT